MTQNRRSFRGFDYQLSTIDYRLSTMTQKARLGRRAFVVFGRFSCENAAKQPSDLRKCHQSHSNGVLSRFLTLTATQWHPADKMPADGILWPLRTILGTHTRPRNRDSGNLLPADGRTGETLLTGRREPNRPADGILGGLTVPHFGHSWGA
jgi:hypothetical protein